jgi:[protein-PII] uridylyltransferase
LLDVDIMVLTPESLSDGERVQVAHCVAFLWDIGLAVGHSVRTISECMSRAWRTWA